MKTLRIYITGVVQGVFFRTYLKEKADELKLRGFARNLEDGRVEVVVEGKDETVNQMLEYCRNGPPHSSIKNVETIEIKNQGFKDFKILKL